MSDAIDDLPAPAPPAPPVPLAAFARTLRGTENEVWTRVLGLYHGGEKHTVEDWRRALDALRRKPA